MLSHPTSQTLNALGLGGMAKALEEQRAMQSIEELCFEERLALLIDREKLHRMNRRLTTRLKKAKLRHAACFEDIDLHSPRGLDKTLVMSLGSCSWVGKGHNVLITGATGVVYGVELLKALRRLGVTSHLIISEVGIRTLGLELDMTLADAREATRIAIALREAYEGHCVIELG